MSGANFERLVLKKLTDLSTEIKQVRIDLSADIQQVRTNLDTKTQDLREDIQLQLRVIKADINAINEVLDEVRTEMKDGFFRLEEKIDANMTIIETMFDSIILIFEDTKRIMHLEKIVPALAKA